MNQKNLRRLKREEKLQDACEISGIYSLFESRRCRNWIERYIPLILTSLFTSILAASTLCVAMLEHVVE